MSSEEAELSKTLEDSSLQTAKREPSQNKEVADVLKAQANEAFKKGDYETATDLYTKAIDIHPDAILYSNRSFSYLKREYYGYALSDAKKALEYDSKYVKAYYRRASAQMALGKYASALNDYEYVKKVCPNDKDAAVKYEECKKIVTRIRFEKAISVDETNTSVSSQIDINSMPIEKEYDGPQLDANGQVTKDFMMILLSYFENEKKLHKRFAYQILLQILTLFKSLPSLIEINVLPKKKFTICGDIHGQFYDLLNIFKLNGPPSDDNPYVMHGGLFSKDDVTLKDIKEIDRVRQPPDDGLMSELLWSDPQPQNGRSESKRGVGLQFGPDVTEKFIKMNNLEYVVRSHEVKQEGYELAHNNKCITVFSAPNYCDTMGNKGAYITIFGDNVTPQFTSYTAVEHPKVRPMAFANNLSMFGLM
ncbi:unnamed protein product [Didymodactylos carnosus]|uniref:protein-serine/threonine phosphatase n=1 Tax=Didymodactylos carnosus TaxID=1234261 RepID=A0A814PR43_9BILA|nr:unnamed protein product [Didymodactylos carnosus]CAF1109397.1 unnamed protein product [Didymodactylos carnosus]CAF3674129.1 unnamed protein product [Didymodactylos carnosus]CAF3873832.1 unnamed protein product [Didymodactylos carnosus]